VTVASFDDPKVFKKTMADCFENWTELGDKTGLPRILTIINDILAASLGNSAVTLTDLDSASESLASLIYSLYQKVPYHNICHGIMVSYYTYLFTGEVNTPETETKALLFAGLLHDIGHNGYTNGNCGKVGEAEGNRFCKLKPSADGSACQPNFDDAKFIKKYVTEKSIHKILPVDMNEYAAKANAVVNIWSSVFEIVTWSRPDKSEVKTPFTAFCQTAELHHALIAKTILENKSVSGLFPAGTSVDDFIKMVVIAILHTDMELYGFGKVPTRYQEKEGVSSPTSAYPLLHMADILAVGEDNETLRRAILRKVTHEFYQESELDNPSPLGKGLGNVALFLDSQKTFTNNLVATQADHLVVSQSKGGSIFTEYLERAKNTPYDEMIAKIDNKQESEEAGKFKSDLDDAKKGPMFLII